MLQTNSWKKIVIITLCYSHKAVESADKDQKINKTAQIQKSGQMLKMNNI